MHGRLSAKTLYLRYFSPVKRSPTEQIAIFTDVDHDSRVGLVAVLGGEIIAAGTYHRDPVGDTDAAEVAFLVEDSQQGRGLGSILLEHLAAAAQERGIRRFTAEVLSQNTKMLRVFMDAGYTVHRRVRLRRRRPGVRHRTDREVPGGDDRPGAPGGGPVDRPAARTAVDRGHRSLRRARHAGPHRAGEPVARRLRRAGVPGEPGRRVGAGGAGLRRGHRHPRSGRPGRGDGAGLERRRGGRRRAGPRACTAWW